jgi:hypothetical protein
VYRQHASMGPWLSSHGTLLVAEGGRGTLCPLQWGRGFSATERLLDESPVAYYERLQ